jgi:DNA-binding NtrC family response regulator
MIGIGTILVVDDESAIRDVARHALELKGFTVITANDGEEAVAIFEDRHSEVALVLLDLIMMPMDGEEAFRKMRKIDATVPVILSSGHNGQELIERASKEGFADFLQKPYDIATLWSHIEAVLEGRSQI